MSTGGRGNVFATQTERSTAATTGDGDLAALRAEVETLRGELQRERVESGRVKALNQKVKELEAAVASASLPENLRGSVSDEVVQAAHAMASREAQGVRSETDQRFDAERTERARFEAQSKADHERVVANQKAMFDARVSERFPKFFVSVGAGGDKSDAWGKYMNLNGPSVFAAYNNFDFEAVCYHIAAFYREIGVSSNADGATAATADPRGDSGSGESRIDMSIPGTKKTYGYDEYVSEMDKVQKDFYAHRIDRKTYDAKIKELESAVAESRVKGPDPQ